MTSWHISASRIKYLKKHWLKHVNSSYTYMCMYAFICYRTVISSYTENTNLLDTAKYYHKICQNQHAFYGTCWVFYDTLSWETGSSLIMADMLCTVVCTSELQVYVQENKQQQCTCSSFGRLLKLALRPYPA